MSQNSSDQQKKTALWKRIVVPIALGLGVVTVYFIVQIALQFLTLGLDQAGVNISAINSSVLMTLLLGLSWIVTLLVVILIAKRIRRPVTKKLVGIEKLNWLDVVLPIPLSIASMLLGGILASIAMQFFPAFEINQVQDVGFSNISLPIEYIAAFIALVVIAPIAEEVLFRGYIYGTFKTYMPTWIAIILVSVLFGAAHLQWNVAIATFALSIFLCLSREFTGNIYAAIFMHMLKNGIAYYLLFINPSFLSTLGA